MSALLTFISKHAPRTIVFININGENFAGLLQVLKQEQIIDHSIEYKCNHLVKTWELIEIQNGHKTEYIYYHGHIGNEFHFKSGIIHRPSEMYNCVKYETIYDMTVDHRETHNIDTYDVQGYWEFDNSWNFVMQGEDISNNEVREIIDNVNHELESEHSSQASFEEQNACNCWGEK